MTRVYFAMIFSGMLSMTACLSGGSGTSSATALQTDAPSTSPTSSTSAASDADPSTPAQLNPCTDSFGIVRQSGTSWSLNSTAEEYYTCSDSSTPPQKNFLSTFLCTNGVIDMIGQTIGPGLNNSGTSSACVAAVPTLTAIVEPNYPLVDTPSSLAITSANTESVAYACSEIDSGTSLASGSVASGAQNVSLTANGDFRCTVTSTDNDGTHLSMGLTVPINCGNKLRVGNHCEDFVCKQVIAIAPSANGTINVPARTGDGTCYSMQLMSKIANSPSSLTTTIDTDVVSRNHDVNAGDPTSVHNPYLMGKSVVNFNLGGQRVVKMAGGPDSTTPILVDNFVVRGLYLANSASVDASSYSAYGTSDSEVYSTGGILFQNQVVPLTPFATGGTSTVAPLDLSPLVKPLLTYTLDLRAEDCGGSRELSDIYLLFE